MWEEMLMSKLNRATKYCSFSELCGPEEQEEDEAAAAAAAAALETAQLPTSGELRAEAKAWEGPSAPCPASSDGDTAMPEAQRRPMRSVRDQAPGDAQYAAPKPVYAAMYDGVEEEAELEGEEAGADNSERCQPPYLPNLGSDFGVVMDKEDGASGGSQPNVKLPSQLGSDLGDDQSHMPLVSQPVAMDQGNGAGYGKPPAARRPSYLLPGAGPGVTHLGVADALSPGHRFHHHGHDHHPVDVALEAAMQPHGAGTDLYSPSSPSLHRQWSGSSSKSSHSVHYVPQEEVKVLCKIGEGAFGEVSLATAPIFGKVAVKWLKATKLGGRHSPAFWQEAEMLGSLNHPNVIRFFGVVVESVAAQNVVGIITEYMGGGSLSALLHTPPGLPLPPVIPLRRRAELALGAVNGMAYLHELRIVHFDLKPDNLLLDGDLYTATAVKVTHSATHIGLLALPPPHVARYHVFHIAPHMSQDASDQPCGQQTPNR